MKTANYLALLSVFTPATQVRAQQMTSNKPNILWIVSEDNSAGYLHCYGNHYATTPNIDNLAGKGFLYNRAYANSPVCSPARNSILTGAYAASNGNEQMRSNYSTSDRIGTYAGYLRQAGYYCTNNSKTDYNSGSIDPNKIWDESSNKATYKNRPAGKPFFAVFNLMTTHESSIHNPVPAEKLRHDPAKITLAPYHPDTKEMRHDYAQYYDNMEDMDAQVGKLLKELEESGLAESTIVFYYGDNGGVIARSKRYVYESGTRIPLVIYIPEKFKDLYPAERPGQQVSRIVSFVDLAPTLLSIVGAPIPEYMQGHAFLGAKKTGDPEYAFMTRGRMDERYDMSRAVRDRKYRYIRNYMPFRIYGQHLDYLFNAPSARSWETAYKEGKCNAMQSAFWQTKPVEELYDMENDPWEVHNLAGDPALHEVLVRMRKALTHWMIDIKDVGLIPETDYDRFAGGQSMYDYMRSDSCPLQLLIQASGWAVLGNPDDVGSGVKFLHNSHSAIRYWGATGLLIRKESARSAIPELTSAGEDPSSAVATLAAEALWGLGETKPAAAIYNRILLDTVSFDMTDRNFALNSIDAIDCNSMEIKDTIRQFYLKHKSSLTGFARYNAYDALMSEWLLKKWNVIE
ncbi:MAG: sulfatase [Bacteroidales bacterium]|nr:sulfatase [Bacteroidales bacterium]